MRGIGEQIEVEGVVAIFEERPLAPVAALSDVVRDAWKDEARETGHAALAIGLVRADRFGVIARVTVIPRTDRRLRTPAYPSDLAR